MKFYIVGPGKDGKGEGEGSYILITEEGERLASHFCSDSSFARSDLESGRPERQKEWKAKFGDYEVLNLGEDEVTFDKLLELNKKQAETNKNI